MFISPLPHVLDLIDRETQLQQAGVDLTVRKIESFRESGQLDFDNRERHIARGNEISNNHLEGGEAYRVTYNETISVPEDGIGFVYPRSSLMRNGAHLVSAVWDPGYEGKGQGLIQVLNPYGITLEENARIGQIIFAKVENPSEHTYRGEFQGENL